MRFIQLVTLAILLFCAGACETSSQKTSSQGDGSEIDHQPVGEGESEDTGQNLCSDPITWYADKDADGFTSATDTEEACEQPEGYVDTQSDIADCNDADATVHPGALEYCNEIDDNCDGTVDDNPEDPLELFADVDRDGFGDPGHSIKACSESEVYVSNSDDCNDENAAINPDADEIDDGLDNDCDGVKTAADVNDADFDGVVDALDADAAYIDCYYASMMDSEVFSGEPNWQTRESGADYSCNEYGTFGSEEVRESIIFASRNVDSRPHELVHQDEWSLLLYYAGALTTCGRIEALWGYQDSLNFSTVAVDTCSDTVYFERLEDGVVVESQYVVLDDPNNYVQIGGGFDISIDVIVDAGDTYLHAVVYGHDSGVDVAEIWTQLDSHSWLEGKTGVLSYGTNGRFRDFFVSGI